MKMFLVNTTGGGDLSKISTQAYHRDRLTKNPVELNCRTGLGTMGIELERHHRSEMLTEGKSIQRKLVCRIPVS
jgi:hypothetical protein